MDAYPENYKKILVTNLHLRKNQNYIKKIKLFEK